MFTANYGILTSFKMNPRQYPKSIVWVPATNSINNLLLTHAEFVGFFGHLNNLPHAFLRRESERICPHVPALRHLKEPSTPRELRRASKITCIFLSFASRSLSCLCGAWRLWRWMKGTYWGKGTIGLQSAVPKKPHTRPLFLLSGCV